MSQIVLIECDHCGEQTSPDNDGKPTAGWVTLEIRRTESIGLGRYETVVFTLHACCADHSAKLL